MAIIGVTVLAGLVQIFFSRSIPSISYQGSYVEKRLYNEPSRVSGVPPRLVEYLEAFDKIVITNPLNDSIWISGIKDKDCEFVKARVEHTLVQGSARDFGSRWRTGGGCWNDGFVPLEIPAKSTIIVLLPALTKSHEHIAQLRIPYSKSTHTSRGLLSGLIEMIVTFFRGSEYSGITVPTRALLEEIPDQVDRVVDPPY